MPQGIHSGEMVTDNPGSRRSIKECHCWESVGFVGEAIGHAATGSTGDASTGAISFTV